ncbi:MAG: hypothetical protein AAF205_00010 [Pseudomonadota bacterium]
MSDVDTSADAGGVETSSDSWFSGIEDPEVLERVGEYQSPAELASAYTKARKEIDGANQLIHRRAEQIAADPELAAQMRQHDPNYALPDDAFGYGWDAIPDEVRALGWNEEQQTAYADFAYENGISKQQFDGLIDLYGQMQIQQLEARADQIDALVNETETTLRAEWGRQYEAKRQDVIHAIDRIFPEHIRKEVLNSGLLADTDMTANLAEIGAALRGVGRLPGATGDKGNAGLTPQQAEAELDRIIADPKTDEILSDKMSAEGAALKARMEELARQAYGDE